jgi:hypothetical protein
MGRQNKAQSKRDLAPVTPKGRDDNWNSGDDWRVPQRKSEGRGWADMRRTTADNTYTGKGGSKRGD